MSGPGGEWQRRLRARRTRRLLLLIGALILLLIGVAALPQDTHPGGLAVPTDSAIGGSGSGVGVVQGVLRAARTGSRVCFWVDERGGRVFLVFRPGWSADEGLHLRGEGGVVLAKAGDTMAFLGVPRTDGAPAGCTGTGRSWSTTDVRRAPAGSRPQRHPLTGPTTRPRARLSAARPPRGRPSRRPNRWSGR